MSEGSSLCICGADEDDKRKRTARRTAWFPSRRRGRAIALFMLAIALTGLIGAPLSGWILHAFDGFAGLKGWQMLFLLEGIPSILLGITGLYGTGRCASVSRLFSPILLVQVWVAR